jgi:hypothetical protein
MAVLPEWNQNGNLEFIVVPEGCDIIILEGLASSQKLIKPNKNKQLPLGGHARLQTIGSLQCVFLPQGCSNVDEYYLRGGTNQIDIVDNWDNNLRRVGFAFRQCMSCITIIQTGFDVELEL